MKKFVRWYYLATFLTVLILFVGVGVVWQSFSSAAILAPGDVNNVFGWAWSHTTGWVSLNSKNCDDLNNSTEPDPCTSSGVDYGLKLTVNNEGTGGSIDGYAWSENMGWICFGSTCTGTPPDSPPKAIAFSCEDGGEVVTCDEVTSAYINGWAKIVSNGDEGWIRLTDYGAQSPRVVFGESSTSTNLDGFMYNYAGGGTLAGSYGVGWLRFAEGQEVLFPYLRAEGGDIFSRGSIRTFFPPPEGIGNAQYLIHVQGSTISNRFRTNLELIPESQVLCNVGDICKENDFALIANAIDPDANEQNTPYNFKLGRFDFFGLRTITNSGLSQNKYGDTVAVGAPNFSSPLNNTVHFVSGNYTVGSEITIPNGTNNSSGAGTVVVLGDMIINNNIKYTSEVAGSRQQLASVAWIVMGDVKIAPTVTNLVGSFIVYGKLGPAIGNICEGGNNEGNMCTIAANCTGGGACVHKCRAVQANGELYDQCGKFITGDPTGDNSNERLVVSGTVFARQFILLRSYVNVLNREPAETFSADGRIQLNPPPGLSDFAKGLPTFRR